MSDKTYLYDCIKVKSKTNILVYIIFSKCSQLIFCFKYKNFMELTYLICCQILQIIRPNFITFLLFVLWCNHKHSFTFFAACLFKNYLYIHILVRNAIETLPFQIYEGLLTCLRYKNIQLALILYFLIGISY